LEVTRRWLNMRLRSESYRLLRSDISI
jgi:hypothetical protein